MSLSERRRLFVAWSPVALYMSLIFALSSLPAGPKWLPLIPFADKGAHFLEYGGLGFLTTRAAFFTFPAKSALRLVAFAWLVAVGFAISDEFHQAFVPGRRGGDAGDLAADAIGALTGGMFYVALTWFRVGRARVSRP